VETSFGFFWPRGGFNSLQFAFVNKILMQMLFVGNESRVKIYGLIGKSFIIQLH